MRQHLLAFVTRLRTAGVRVSIAESLDAMAAVEEAGIERPVLREALAATLVKEEDDRATFDRLFDEHFPLLAAPAAGGRRGRGARGGPGEPAAGAGGSGGSGGGAAARPPEGPREPGAARTGRPPGPGTVPPPGARQEARRRGEAERRAAERAQGAAPAQGPATERRAGPHERRADAASRASGRPAADAGPPRPPIARREIAVLDPDDLDRARAAARELGRRFAARRARRQRRERRGHVDVRRTIRAAVSRGGALIDLQRRGRRPGKPDLVVLCDVSGSVARASELMLTLLVAAEGAFTRVQRFAFVDALVPIDFEGGHIRPDGELDLHAFSDFGRVLGELEERNAVHVDRRTILLILGDARNNRRPSRADVLRRLARRCRAVVWAVPEPRARWDTGDSALAAYAPHCDLVLEATSLTGLLGALREAAKR